MPRETFQQELDGLIGDVLDLGKEVEGSLENMVVAMEARDADVAGRGASIHKSLSKTPHSARPQTRPSNINRQTPHPARAGRPGCRCPP
jgi:hypothetical protein